VPNAPWDELYFQAYRSVFAYHSGRDPGPGIVSSYLRSARHEFGSVGQISLGSSGRGPYRRLSSLIHDVRLAATLGANLKVQMRDPVRYGDEETVAARLAASGATWHVILMTLASTPEVENHGAFLTAWRDWLAKNATTSPLLILIDEGPYAARMRGEAAFEQRVQERRKLWREFISGYGLRGSFADLIQIKPGGAVEINARDEARAALWTAGERA